MPLADLVAPNAIIPALKVNGKKQTLQELAAKAADLSGQSERTIFEILMQREKLGSTGVGNGIAIPHGKLEKLNKQTIAGATFASSISKLAVFNWKTFGHRRTFPHTSAAQWPERRSGSDNRRREPCPPKPSARSITPPAASARFISSSGGK